MKRILSIFPILLVVFSMQSCMSDAEQKESEIIANKVIKSLKDNRQDEFRSLFLTENEFIKMGLDGQKQKEETERVLTRVELSRYWKTMSLNIDKAFVRLQTAGRKAGINWKTARLLEIKDLNRKTEVGVNIWRIEATLQSGQTTYTFKLCDACQMTDGHLKLVQVHNQD